MSALSVVPSSATWNCLETSNNFAALTALGNTLKASTSLSVRNAALASLLRRKEPEAHWLIIRNWSKLPEIDTEVFANESGKLAAVASELLQSGEKADQQLALRVIADLGLTESIDAVLSVVMNHSNSLSQLATDCLLEMCKLWGSRSRTGKDNPRVRAILIERLYYHLATFHEHRCTALIDAWLNLVHWEDTDHRRVLADPGHPAYQEIIKRLSGGTSPAVLQLLAGYITRCRNTPRRILEILVQRPEPQLAFHIASLLEDRNLPTALNSVRRLPPLACLAEIENHVDDLNPMIERRVWLLVSASSTNLNLILRGADKLARVDSEESCATAAAMVRGCRRPNVETIVHEIQQYLLQPSRRDLTGFWLTRLTDWLDCNKPVLRNAAKAFLSEFTIPAMLDAIRNWPSEMCQAMAQVVKKMDTTAHECLAPELQSPAPRRRLAAIEVTKLLNASKQLIVFLLPLLDDPNLKVRVRAIDALARIGHPDLIRRLPQFLADPSTDIQDAAMQASEMLNLTLSELPA